MNIKCNENGSHTELTESKKEYITPELVDFGSVGSFTLGPPPNGPDAIAFGTPES